MRKIAVISRKKKTRKTKLCCGAGLRPQQSFRLIRGAKPQSDESFVDLRELTKNYRKQTDFRQWVVHGKSYEAIGMKFVGYTGPDKTCLIYDVAYKRNPSKYKEYKEKAEAVIWGAGSKKYLWKKEESL